MLRDKKKLALVRGKIEQRIKRLSSEDIVPTPEVTGMLSELKYLRRFIDSMDEEGNIKDIGVKESTGKLKECVDNITEKGLEEQGFRFNGTEILPIKKGDVTISGDCRWYECIEAINDYQVGTAYWLSPYSAIVCGRYFRPIAIEELREPETNVELTDFERMLKLIVNTYCQRVGQPTPDQMSNKGAKNHGAKLLDLARKQILKEETDSILINANNKHYKEGFAAAVRRACNWLDGYMFDKPNRKEIVEDFKEMMEEE